jgi:hypothetical protein
MSLSHSPRIVNSGLVLCLDAANRKSYSGSGNTWVDISTNRLSATLNSSNTTYSTNFEGTFVFNGSNSFIQTTLTNYPLVSWTEPFSTECWIYIPTSDTWNTTYRSGIFHRGSFNGFHGLIKNLTNNQVAFALRGNTGNSNQTNGNITRDSWHHLVGTWSGTNTGALSNLYINGTLANSSNLSSVIVEAPEVGAPWIIGNPTVEGSTGSYFTGNISNAKIYNRALTQSEVQQNFNALRGRFGI